MMEWYIINNIDEVDSPALVLYEARIKDNIRRLKSMVSGPELLRPHVKTNKMAEVCQLMMQEGIRKFKCATIAEAEMLAQIKAPDVLLAYQPVGPKIQRLLALVQAYPDTHFSCATDNRQNAGSLSKAAGEKGITLDVYIDLNVGMNRTGIKPGGEALAVFDYCMALPNIKPVGLHAYDGHIRDKDIVLRQYRSDDAFLQVQDMALAIQGRYYFQPVIVVGGSPSFPTHARRLQVECSPGTFVFWDWGYKHQLPDEPFDYAALVITRVISILDEHTICTDLGHKAVAAENPLPRVHFLNIPAAAGTATPISQSEEHLVMTVADASQFTVGDVLYGVPVHICPTVALYDKAVVIKDYKAVEEWKVTARGRKINW